MGSGAVFRSTYWHNDGIHINLLGLFVGILVALLGMFGTLGAFQHNHEYLKYFLFGCIFWLVVIVVQIMLSALRAECNYMLMGCNPSSWDWFYNFCFIMFLVLCSLLAYSLRKRPIFPGATGDDSSV
eukprot:TRINITY_DN3420_c0_g1_i2.p1 TRINITY_DN3420_c0_g1~~TRINITY_DN3420_c0_g1_i2.p1  ORF type:complete len:127 (+),score=9.74 TRINITY_DN3420_c0_g1_i2:169-549(+)